MKKILLLIIAFFAFWNVTTAQVNIGSDDEPESFSVLQLVGTDGGLRINQLDGTQVAALASSIKASEKLAEAQGLLIYNTTEGCYNMFKGEGFQSLCAASQAAFDTDSTLLCGSLEVYGEYVEGQTLDESHYLKLSVLCTRPGSYTFTCTMHNEDGTNGYAFTKSDVMLEAGRHILTVYGSGTPINPGLDTLHIFINQTRYSCPDEMISVGAAPERAVFEIVDAKQADGVTHFLTNQTYNDDGIDAIEATIRVSQGGEQTELIAIINGVEFKYTPESGSTWEGPTGYYNIDYKCDGNPVSSPEDCSGTLTADTLGANGSVEPVEYTVTLRSTGNPVTYGWHEGKVQAQTGKNGATVYSPPVSLLFLSRSIHIVGASSGDIYNLAHSTGNSNLPYQMLTQPGNFIYKDKENPGLYIEGFTFQELTTQPTEAQLNNADIVNIGYNTVPSGDNYSIVNFVKNKQGVLLFFSQDNFTPTSTLIKAITGETVTINNGGSNYGAGSTYEFTGPANDPIINGHFGPLTGLYWGEDAGTNNCITSAVPARFIVYSRNGTYPNCIRDNRLGFIWAGDGGFVSNALNNTDKCCYPFTIDATTKLPIGKINYEPQPVYNSLFIANSVWWAIDFLRKNGRID